MMNRQYLQILILLLFCSIFVSSQQICGYQPAGCQLQCDHGYIRDLAGRCTCSCGPSPCQLNTCKVGQICQARGTKAVCSESLDLARKECPRISGGVCALRCETDLDCKGRLICCSNGCGRECVVAVQLMHIPAARPIQPVNGNNVLHHFLTAVRELPRQMNFLPVKVQNKQTEQQVVGELHNQQKDKIGECRALSIQTKECKETVSKCHEDGDCLGYQKCCMTHCGPRCMDPVKATVCVHLALAVGRLPNRELANGYAPSCTVQGKFSPVQCDRSECWCVDVNYGTEIAGTRVLNGMRKADMCINIRPCSRTCPGHCPHGLLMDQYGCPVEGCLCKDVCHGVKCVNPSDSCQLVEPDCGSPPCLPVPRCLINPCPSGFPMTLPTGITALCAHNEQCSAGHWCYMIGYNGLGFCCSGNEPSFNGGQCPQTTPNKSSSCSSTCSTDEDCSQGKCCFDGCGLSCMDVPTPEPTTSTITTTTTEIPETTTRKISVFQPGQVALENKEHLTSLVADCPNIVSTSNCSAECTSDTDCPGMKRCCRAGCGTQCSYFEKSTHCFHMSLTSELYSTRAIMKCDAAGFFERIQCDDHGCFCADINNGQEIAGSRKADGNPDCFALRQCEDHGCRTSCPYGYALNPEGCPTCKCVNPCQEVKCHQGSICVMTSVDCFTEGNCPPQPRCILNMCPIGDPAVSPVGVTENCSKNDECPKNHWCHDYGLSSGGLCCPLPSHAKNSGTCPAVRPSLHPDMECRLECRSDEDCANLKKCCFDGCGTVCTEVEHSISTPNIESNVDDDKSGICPYFDTRNCGLQEAAANECGTDSQCPGVMKCCSDGCRRMCIYPGKLSRCLQLKAALQQTGQMDRIKCRPGPRHCTLPLCATEMDCKFGLKKDSNGCNTCQCHNPCEGITCPSSSICIPVQSDCTGAYCPEVPRCTINPCPMNRPVLDSSTFEPHICRDSSQCVGSKVEGYCRIFKHQEGYCCTGEEPTTHPGSCPSAVLISGDCTRHCLQDDMCPSGEKCCSNGCGLSCQPAEFANPSSASLHIGECLRVQSMGAFCSQRILAEECSDDVDCPSMYKCCNDGCVRRCLQPAITTHCIHARVSSIAIRHNNPSVFVPECNSRGGFQQIQSHYGLKWCVDSNGDEIPGTKTLKHPNCRYPRSCAVRACSRHCSFGFKTDNNGCIVCDCRDPCEMVDCGAGSACYMMANSCTGDSCQPTPRCVPNVCSSSPPLVDPFTEILAECNSITSCPTGFHCIKSGFIGKGLCCKGSAISSTSHLECPAVSPSNSSIDGSPCIVACRVPSDCRNSVCCFNGCGMSCQFSTGTSNTKSASIGGLQPIVAIAQRPRFKSIPSRPTNPQRAFIIDQSNSQMIKSVDVAPRPPVNNDITTLGAVEPSTISLPTKVGTCPSLILNPGCKEECLTDADCIGFYKCCKASCAAKCVAPKVTTPCIHMLLSYMEETMNADIPPPVQCTNGGHYRKHQCDIKEQQCWCADDLTGHEQPGTRISAALPLPDCSRPKHCFSSCADAEATCPYGVRLDSSGCPANGMCICQNPCQNFACKSPLTNCALGKVECLTEYCPLMPMCVPNICGLYPSEVDVFNNPRTCSSDYDCKDGGRCVFEEHGYRQIGMCCQVKAATQQPPRENKPTNCTLLRKAIDDLHNHGATVKAGKPSCADETGHFTSIQCDSSGSCWCVNSLSGIEILGSRTRNADGKNICAVPRICSHRCDPSLCPYGLQLDQYGCPMSGCHCSSPCDDVQCPKEQVCILRVPNCGHEVCNPVPICEANPCSDGSSPAFDSLIRRQLTCSSSSRCPVGHECKTVHKEVDGLCCKIREELKKELPIEPVSTQTTTSRSKSAQEHKCPHGQPFTGTPDGTPLICKVSSNGCPSTHYCSTRAGERSGVCCVSKRYVCNLALDRGPCSVSLPRFFYSSLNRTCSLFKYGGCAGNLNNFGTSDECQSFCEGVGIDFTFPYQDDSDDAKESYQLGFSLTGPQLMFEDRHPAEISLLRLLTSSYDIPESSIDEIRIKDDNVVRFKISHSNAKEYARTISQAVSTGRLGFSLDDSTYRAEPQTLFAQHISNAPEDMEKARAVFWIALFIAAGLAALIVLALLSICIHLCRSRTKDSQSTGASTPSNFISHSIVAHRAPRTGQRPNQRRELIFSREDLHVESSDAPIRAFRRPSFGANSNRTFQNERPDSVIYC